jgi:hypothetical protein
MFTTSCFALNAAHFIRADCFVVYTGKESSKTQVASIKNKEPGSKTGNKVKEKLPGL